MLRRFNGGAVVVCDVPGCPHTFRSFSRAALVRGQASSDGWTYRENVGDDALTRKSDRCPTHSAAPTKAEAAPAPVPIIVTSVDVAAGEVTMAHVELAQSVSIVAAAGPEKPDSRDSGSLTTETISPVSGQLAPLSAGASAETVGDDHLCSVDVKPVADPPIVITRRRRRGRVADPAVADPAPPTGEPAPAITRRKRHRGREALAMPGTLALVAEVLRAVTDGQPLSVRQIVERCGDRLPSKSKTPQTVVSRDLALAIKHGGEASIFVRTSPGRFMLRELAVASSSESEAAA